MASAILSLISIGDPPGRYETGEIAGQLASRSSRACLRAVGRTVDQLEQLEGVRDELGRAAGAELILGTEPPGRADGHHARPAGGGHVDRRIAEVDNLAGRDAEPLGHL